MLSVHGVGLLLFVLGGILPAYSTKPLASRNDRPIIKFLHFENSYWQNLTNDYGIHTLKSLEIGDLDIECEAPFPIQWNITGVITPVDIIKVHPPTRLFSPDIFRISAAFLFYSVDNSFDLAGSANIACEKVSDYTIRDEFNVFAKGENSKSLLQPLAGTVIDSTLITCPTTDPTTTTHLYLKNPDEGETLVKDVVYHPAEGFRSDKLFNGTYVCRKDETYSIYVTALVTSPSNSEHQFSPLSENIEAFTDEEIEFKCSSKSESVKLEFEDSGDVTVTYANDTDYMKSACVKIINETYAGKGKVSCVTGRGGVINVWSYEFIVAPQLYLDNYAGQIHCLSSSTPRDIQTVHCQNPMECRSYLPCFRNSTSCNFDSLKQFYSDKELHCWLRHLGSAKMCNSMPFSHLNGIVQCTAQGLTKQWEFFMALDSLRYTSWQHASEHALLRMDDMPEILYTNSTVQFVCVASAFLFADSLAFEIEYKNGSHHLLHSDGVSANVTIISEESPRKIREFNIMASLDINLPIDAVGISCLAPWWNSTDVMKASKTFETRRLFSPQTMNNEREVKETLYIGERNRRIVCPVKGEPQPSYTWLFKGQNVISTHPELKTSIGKDGEGYLEFPTVDPKYAGEYECLASNYQGLVSVKYMVEIPDQCRYNLDCKV